MRVPWLSGLSIPVPASPSPNNFSSPFNRARKRMVWDSIFRVPLCAAFQGDIEYEPQPAGCCFAVILALASEQQPKRGFAPDGENPAPATRRPHAFSRDVEPPVGNRARFSRGSDTVLPVTEALDALGRNHVDLVLLDYDLGNRQNGFQFMREAREARLFGTDFHRDGGHERRRLCPGARTWESLASF